MKNIISTGLVLGVILSGSIACASDTDFSKQLEFLQSEIEAANLVNDGKKNIRAIVAKTNLQYLERSVLKKIKHIESRLASYQNKLSSSLEDSELAELLEKIEAAEKKLKDLNDMLLGIEMLKARATN